MKEENKKKFDMDKKPSESFSEFNRIYAQYFTPLYRYTLNQTKNREVAEDIIQNVFLKVLKKFPTNQLPPLPYFFTITRNAVIDYWKKKKEIILDISEAPFSSLIDESTSPYEKINHELNTTIINQALDAISFEQKEVLTLRFISDLPNLEIAKLLGKTEEAVRQIQYRALKKLRELI